MNLKKAIAELESIVSVAKDVATDYELEDHIQSLLNDYNAKTQALLDQLKSAEVVECTAERRGDYWAIHGLKSKIVHLDFPPKNGSRMDVYLSPTEPKE